MPILWSSPRPPSKHPGRLWPAVVLAAVVWAVIVYDITR